MMQKNMVIKQKKNIEWSEISTSPITGCNGPGGKRCIGCYAERIAMRFAGLHGYPKDDPFRPTWHPERLNIPIKRKKPTVFFQGSMCDWLDQGVESSWRRACLIVMEAKSNHIFITLTKQYDNLVKVIIDSPEGTIPPNVILGISVTKKDQVTGIDTLREMPAHCKAISFEPLLEDLAPMVDLGGIDWIIIGARSKQNKIGHLPAVPGFQPKKEWVNNLVRKAVEEKIPVFMKPNLLCYGPLIQEYPFMRDGNGFIYTHGRWKGYRLEAEK